MEVMAFSVASVDPLGSLARSSLLGAGVLDWRASWAVGRPVLVLGEVSRCVETEASYCGLA